MVSPELLRQYTLFSGLTPGQLKELAMIGESHEYSQGEMIFEADQPASHLCFVLEGKVDLLTEFPDGSQQAWMDVTRGFLLCWSSVIKPFRYSFSARAATQVQMLKLDGPKLRELMEKDHDLGYVIMTHIAHAVAERLRATRAMLVSLRA